MAIESEKSFQKALASLEARVKKLGDNKSAREAKLEEQNVILQQGLDSLKQDYEKMEVVFVDLKEQVTEAQKAAVEAQAGTDSENAQEANAKTASLEAERDTLKEELAMTRRDYEAIEDSLAALKRQYAEVEESGQSFYEEMSSAAAGVVSQKEFDDLQTEKDELVQQLEKIKEDYVMQLAENELLIAEANGVASTKESLKKSLDKSIEKLEQITLN